MCVVCGRDDSKVFEFFTEEDPEFEISSGVGRCIIHSTKGLVIVRGPLPNFLAGFGAARQTVEAATLAGAEVFQLRQPTTVYQRRIPPA